MPLRPTTPLPILAGVTKWLNSETGQDDLSHHPVLVQFWAVSCPICKLNMPAVQAFMQAYGPHGLRLVSVHMPRMESDTNVEAVKAAALELNMTEPCAIDNDHTIGERFQTGGVWPCYFLFDADHKLRRHAAGMMGLKLLEGTLKRLLDAQAVAA